MWALGILLYTIVYKENPFYNIGMLLCFTSPSSTHHQLSLSLVSSPKRFPPLFAAMPLVITGADILNRRDPRPPAACAVLALQRGLYRFDPQDARSRCRPAH